MKLVHTTENENSICTRVHCRRIARELPLSSLCETFSKLENPSILGGHSAEIENNNYSYFAAQPADIFEFKLGEEGFEEKLNQLFSRYSFDEKGSDIFPEEMFCGGWIGYFSYDLKDYFENFPNSCADEMELPLVRLSFYDSIIAHDRINDEFILMALEIGDGDNWHAKLDWLDAQLELAKLQIVEIPEALDIEKVQIDEVASNMTRGEYLDAIVTTKQYITDGEVYQINFSQCFNMPYVAEPISLYHWQNRNNPSPYAAFLSFGETSIVCASPEVLLDVYGQIIATSPIKGTRARIIDCSENSNLENEMAVADLRDCEKEKAELNMIIDLERNDLARVCASGTRYVSKARHIEPFATVFHAVATVEGRLRESVGFVELLRSTFPGGSITGAPKIRAMEVIDQLEPTNRGVYTGSIGLIGIDGSVCLNIAIRTVIIKRQIAYIQTGGGIVADSDPRREWDETITKARAQLAGIRAV